MTISYTMPRTPVVGTVDRDGNVTLNEGYQRFFGAIEVIDRRVAANVDTSTGTVSDVISALKAAGLMRTS